MSGQLQSLTLLSSSILFYFPVTASLVFNRRKSESHNKLIFVMKARKVVVVKHVTSKIITSGLFDQQPDIFLQYILTLLILSSFIPSFF